MRKLIKKILAVLLEYRPISYLYRRLSAKDGLKRGKLRPKRNLAIYDLGVNPVTFDFAFFLYEASCYFRKHRIEKFELLIVTKMVERLWEQEIGMLNVINTEKKEQRIYDLLLPIAHLYKECESVNLVHDMLTVNHILSNAALVYPNTYSVKYPQKINYQTIFRNERKGTEFEGIIINSEDISRVKKWLKIYNINRPFVTFTLRSYAFQESRNSNPKILRKFLKYLNHSGFTVIIVPDTDNIEPIKEFKDCPIFFQGTFNIYQRAALYELAYTNLFTSNGTYALSIFNKKSSFIFTKLVNEHWPIEAHEARGQLFGSQPFSLNRGVHIWEEESLEVLISAFEKIKNWKK